MKKSLLLFGALLFLAFNANATKHTFTASGTQFSPTNISNVDVGDTIRWEWQNGSHTTTSVTIPNGALAWSNPLNSANQSFEYPVLVAGNYSFKCIPHELMGMAGTFTAANPSSNPCDTLNCDDTDACTTDACDSITGCVNTPVSCDDSDSCTTDACNAINGCTNTPIVGCTVSARDIMEDDIRIYPNPVQDVFSIEGLDASSHRIFITDVNGKIVYDTDKLNISGQVIQTSNLPDGAYLLHVETNKGTMTKKLLVAR